MGKPASPPKYRPNQAGATAKYVRVPPRKARLVINAIRGKYVSEALALLKFVPNFAARAIEQVLRSAMANAENGRPVSEDTNKPLPPLNVENLKVVRAFVNEGPRIKRLQPRAQGRAYRILKRMCHISVVLEEAPPKPRPARRVAGRGRAAGGRTAPAGIAAAKAEAAASPKPAADAAATAETAHTAEE
ncbi:MAG: 50S ribosomal protein L22 [Chthonomonadales bacterium]